MADAALLRNETPPALRRTASDHTPDGELSVGQILGAVAQLLALDPAETRARYLPVVRELVDEGFLVGQGNGSAPAKL